MEIQVLRPVNSARMIEKFVSDFAGALPFGYAFGAGMVTTVSPCGVAMLPAYISLNLGDPSQEHEPPSSLKRGARAFLISLAVTLSFVALFAVVGSIVSAGGNFLVRIMPWIAVVIGAALILMGIWITVGGHVYTSLAARLADRLGRARGKGIKGFLVFGLAYGIAALSCTLPIFLIVVGSSIALKGFASGLLQFISYALGMGFVITLVTLGTTFFKEVVQRWLRKIAPLVARLSGLLLMFAGSYILYYWFTTGDILHWTY